jgi:hypothetical protein
MNAAEKKRRIEFGDFQTPDELASDLCKRLSTLGIQPDVIIEPTCGTGAFVVAAAQEFPAARTILGFEINQDYLDRLRHRLASMPDANRIRIEQADFFSTHWREKLDSLAGSILVTGNLPWVTNSAQGVINGSNLPVKSNFLRRSGFDAISGKSNFDISEWMLLEILRWFERRAGDVAMLVKTAVARKVLAQAFDQRAAISDAFLIRVDAKRYFRASVDACLLVMQFSHSSVNSNYDYTVFDSLDDERGHRVGHRSGLTVSDLDKFEANSFLVGQSPKPWRSGIKHDAAAIMEFTLTERGLENGLGEAVKIEPIYLFPLLKGSDVGSGKDWRNKYILVTQNRVGESTDKIRAVAPLTWDYLMRHANAMDSRGSAIYRKNPRFSIFGVGDYAFRLWRIAICGLYKTLRFRLVGPVEGRPVMFDDTVYYLSFDTQDEAREALDKLNSNPALELLSSLIFRDEKRPIKTGILNMIDWTRLDSLRPYATSIQIHGEADIALYRTLKATRK